MMSVPRLPACLVLLGLLASGAPARGADLLKYAPNDCDMLLALDVRALLDAPAVRKLVPRIAQRHGPAILQHLTEELAPAAKLLKENSAFLQKAIADRGQVLKLLDALKSEVPHVLVAGRLNGDDEQMLLVIECNLDSDGLAQLFRRLGQGAGDKLEIGKPDKTGLIEIRIKGEEESWLVGVVEKGICIATPSKAYAQEAVTKAAGKKKGELSKELRTLLQRVDQRQTCWMAAIDSDENLQYRGGISVGDDVRAQLVFTARDAEAAEQQLKDATSDLKDACEYVGSLALLVNELAPLADLLAKVKPVIEGNEVSIRLVIEAEVLDTLIPRN